MPFPFDLHHRFTALSTSSPALKEIGDDLQRRLALTLAAAPLPKDLRCELGARWGNYGQNQIGRAHV